MELLEGQYSRMEAVTREASKLLGRQGRQYHQGAEEAQEGGQLGTEDLHHASQGMGNQLAKNSEGAG